MSNAENSEKLVIRFSVKICSDRILTTTIKMKPQDQTNYILREYEGGFR